MTRKSDLAERADELGLPHSRSTTIPELEKAIIEDEDRRRGATLDEVLRDAAKEVGFHEPIIDNVFGSDLIEMPVSDAYRAMENVVEIVVPAEAEVEPLGTYPAQSEWESLCQMAAVLAGSALVPSALRKKPQDILLVLLTGRDLGIATTTALQQCHVIDGKITVAPKLRLSMLNHAGTGAIRPVQRTATECIIVVERPIGTVVEEMSISMDDVPASLVKKQNWKEYPQRMLWWRLAGWALDDHFPELGLGLYSPDELGSITDSDGVPISPGSVELPIGYEDYTQRPNRGPEPTRGPEPAPALLASEEQVVALTRVINRLKTPEGVTGELAESWKEIRDSFREDWAEVASVEGKIIGPSKLTATDAKAILDGFGNFQATVIDGLEAQAQSINVESGSGVE